MVVFIGVGVLMIVGILRGGEHAGWHNWTVGDAPFDSGFASMIGVAMIVGFSFQGTELIGIAAGESADPAKNIPRAVRQVFWRILLFYVLAILIISLIIPYTSPDLLRNDVKDIAVSPFTLVFRNAGLLSAAAVMNSVIFSRRFCQRVIPACMPRRACCIPWRWRAKRRRFSPACRREVSRVMRW